MAIIHSLWMSKLCYGLQLCTKVRLAENDPTPASYKALQQTQNRMLRVINNSRIRDKISNKSILEKFDLFSVKQLAASIKLVEVWKSLNQEEYPITLEPYNQNLLNQNIGLRPQINRVFNDTCKLKKSESSFHIVAARLWNAAPQDITSATNILQAKSAIRLFCKNLPL